MSHRSRILLFAAVLLSFAVSAVAREWHDSTGREVREGDLVAYREGKVTVRLPSGHEVITAIERFSEADQEYIRSTAEKNEETQLRPRPVLARVAKFESAADRVAQNSSPDSTGTLPSQPRPAGESSQSSAKDGQERVIPGGTKRVFYTACGTFHIYVDAAGVSPIIGTAHYAMRYWQPSCCGCCCSTVCYGPWYLSFLRESSFDGKWLIAEEVGVASPGRWAFGYFNPGPGHPIWYFDSIGKSHFMGYASWAHPQ